MSVMKSEKKALIIACYIGKIPVNINMWIKSCTINADFDFLLVTNDNIDMDLPENVIVLHQELIDLKKRFQKHIDFEITLDSAYKLCDYKPLYALAFEDYVKDYPFWGHCDIDMVFGQINHFFTVELLTKYDRLGSLGHLCLYRNNDQMNHLYEKKGAAFPYKKVFTSNYSYNFDEIFGYNLLCKYNHINWYDCGWEFCLDKCYGYPFSFSHQRSHEEQFVLWKDGLIYLAYRENGQMKYEEKMYYHFSSTKYVLNNPSDIVAFEYSKCMNLEEPVENYHIQSDYMGEKQNDRKSAFNRIFRGKKPYQIYIRIRQEFYRSVLRR